MQLTRAKIPPRIVNRQSRVDGILAYDYDNLYPQRVTDIVNASGTAKYAIRLYSKFIEGNGFKDETFYKTIVNNKGLTMDKLLRKVARDYANRYGFAIHINYNALYQITDVRPVPFHDCRLIHPDNTDYIDKIAIYNDWGKRSSARINKERIEYYDIFNPDPAVIDAQIAAAGGWSNWKGQVFWYSEAGEDYPLAPYDAVLEDIETDGRIKNHKRKKAGNGFNADFAFIYKGKFEDDQARDEFIQNLEGYQGDDGDGDIPLIEVEKEEQIPTLLPFPKVNNDKDFYTSTEQSVQNNIRKAFGFPGVLTGEVIPGKLGLAQEILDACSYVNGLTNTERRVMEETFKQIFDNWYDQNINPTKDYSIIPLTIVNVAATKEVPLPITEKPDPAPTI